MTFESFNHSRVLVKSWLLPRESDEIKKHRQILQYIINEHENKQ
jgi:hypothetical protein